MLTWTPAISEISSTMAVFLVTPPVKVTSGSMPARRSSDIDLEAMATCTPITTSSMRRPLASQPRISDSANTVHVVVIFTGFFAVWASGPRSPSGISRASEAAPRNRPVPAAHLSFMLKSMTWPSAPTLIAFVSWPPMSRTLLVFGNRWTAPRPWQEISVTWASPNWMRNRP